MAELKLVEQKFGGDPWPLAIGRRTPSPSAKRSAGGTKIGGTKNLVGGPSVIGWQGPLAQVQKGQQNKKWQN